MDLKAAFCQTCGNSLQDNVALRVAPRRPAIITILAVFQFLGAALWGLFSLSVAAAIVGSPSPAPRSSVVFASILLVALLSITALQLAGGIGLLKMKRYGYSLLRVWSILGLIAFPVGTIISILILVYLNSPGVKLLFSERPVHDLTTAEYAAMIAATKSNTAAVAVIVIVSVILGVAMIGIIAAIAIPGLLRARIAANEAGAVATLRTFASAEAAYAARNGGRYGSPECLSAPDRCVPGYTGPPFHASPVERVFENNGYIFTFLSPGTVDPQKAFDEPARKIERYALLALPSRSNSTGQRLFCVDSTGTIVWTTKVPPPSDVLTSCPAEWTPMGER